jgi:GrpB-like predicted nucleotidyltransferase (UPF0157 family)
MIVVVPYDPSWPQQFGRIAAHLGTALADVAVVAIEHVGSTSVPGLAAKPVLDIDVIVDSDDIAAASVALERVGYEALGDLGVPERFAFQAPDDDPRRHVYVCVAGSLQLRNHLVVRDVLRVDDGLRADYEAVKWRLVGETDDIDQYTFGKTDVLLRILRQGGLHDDALAAIEAVNRE